MKSIKCFRFPSRAIVNIIVLGVASFSAIECYVLFWHGDDSVLTFFSVQDLDFTKINL